VHATQATASVNVVDPARDVKFEEMIQDAVDTVGHLVPPRVMSDLQSHWLTYSREMRRYYAGLRHRRDDVSARRLFQLRQLLAGSGAVRSQILGRAAGRPKWGDIAPTEIRSWLESIGITPIVPIDVKSTAA